MNLPTRPGADAQCHRINDVLRMVGDKWTVLIVRMLCERPFRFNELRRAVGGISQQMLTRTLKGLERDGVVTRTVYPTVPPQVEYALTPLGQSLAEPVRVLSEWAGAHMDEIEDNRGRFDETVRA